MLRSDASVYAAADLDLTQEVIDLLNREADEEAAAAAGDTTE